MGWEQQEELKSLEDKMNGMVVAVEKGLTGLQKDIQYLTRLYIPVIILSIVALIISIVSLVLTLENRAMFLQQVG